MKGGFVPKFKVSDIVREVETKKKRIDDAIYLRLRRIGLQFVRDARINADFTDRTGNLRSSIGFVIAYNGDIRHTDFDKAPKGDSDKEEGVRNARQFAEDIAGDYSKGWVLIVVAGMEYAAAVESRGKDVITGSSIKAGSSLKKTVKELEAKINGK